MYPIFVRIAAKKEKAYIKTMYEIPDLSQWYNGKVVARTDAAMMNKRLLFELKKYNDRVNAIENNDTWKIQCKLPPKTKRFCPLVLK